MSTKIIQDNILLPKFLYCLVNIFELVVITYLDTIGHTGIYWTQ